MKTWGKKDKVLTVIKKPNWNALWRNIAWHIQLKTCLQSDTHLYLDFRSFLKMLAQIASMVSPLLHFSSLFLSTCNWSWFTDCKHFFMDDNHGVCHRYQTGSNLWNCCLETPKCSLTSHWWRQLKRHRDFDARHLRIPNR